MFVSPGFTFMDNVVAQMSHTALGAFMASANVTAIAISELHTLAHVVLVSATTPASNQGEGSLWFDTTLNLLRVLNNTRWDCPYVGPELMNTSGSTVSAGTWVVGNGDNTYSMCFTRGWPEVIGVAIANTANNIKSLVPRTGIGRTRCKGPLSYGDILIAAGTADAFGGAGYAMGATTVFGFTNFTAGIEIGMALGVLGNTTGLVTCMIWR